MSIVVRLDKRTQRIFRERFGVGYPFVVVRVSDIVNVDGPPTGRQRVTFSNGEYSVEVPDMVGMEFGQQLVLGEDQEVYEWSGAYVSRGVSGNMQRAIAYSSRPIMDI